jgi:hypothetical protein
VTRSEQVLSESSTRDALQNIVGCSWFSTLLVMQLEEEAKEHYYLAMPLAFETFSMFVQRTERCSASTILSHRVASSRNVTECLGSKC